MSSSSPPDRRRSRTGCSSFANRQLRMAPSAVSRSRLHEPQNARVTLVMTPISPRPSTKRKRSAGAASTPARSRARAARPHRCASRISSPGTTCERCQASPASSGMNSMNRTTRPVSAGEGGEVEDLVVVYPGHHDDVDLHRWQTRPLRRRPLPRARSSRTPRRRISSEALRVEASRS